MLTYADVCGQVMQEALKASSLAATAALTYADEMLTYDDLC